MTTFKIDATRLQETIFDTFRELGFCCGRTGYKYAVDYITDSFDLYTAGEHSGVQIQTWYKAMAEKYNTSPNAVERALRTTIRDAVANNSSELTNIFSESALHNGSFGSNRNFLNGIYQYLLANCVLFGFGREINGESEVNNA